MNREIELLCAALRKAAHGIFGGDMSETKTEEPSPKERHRLYHVRLHEALDELMGDWAIHNCHIMKSNGEPKLFSNTTMMEFMQWSKKQTTDPEL